MTGAHESGVIADSAVLATQFAGLVAAGKGWHVQGCRDCQGSCFPPRLRCPHCGSAQSCWTPAGTEATLVSFVRVSGDNPRHRAPRALREHGEYTTGIVDLASHHGVRFPVLLLGDDAAACVVGDAIDIDTRELGGRVVPLGRLRKHHRARATPD